jgi:uncharacterized RDD family membrane protein YckC
MYMAEASIPPDVVNAPERKHWSAGDYVRGTIVARHIAASVDLGAALILALFVGAFLPDDSRLMQLAVMTAVCLAYYFVTEAILSRTPGKFLAGLAVLRLDGRRITWGQAAVRTLLRLIEFNPILLGGLPAALFVIFTPRRQRIGDLLARTVVVSAKHMRS